LETPQETYYLYFIPGLNYRERQYVASKFLKLLAMASSLLGFQVIGYLIFTWRSGIGMLRISGMDVRADIAWPIAVLLTVPLWIALVRSAIANPPARYTSATLLRRWIQLQLSGEITEQFVASRRLEGR
jgi:hypothetical protein